MIDLVDKFLELMIVFDELLDIIADIECFSLLIDGGFHRDWLHKTNFTQLGSNFHV